MRKLLLADDSATIRKVVQLCFADEPFEFASASAGMEASELLRTWRPDVLLVDVLLPEIDGYQLCRQAKQENGIPVLLLVGAFEPFDLAQAQRSGYDIYLTKPFDTLQLVQVVKEATARAGSADRGGLSQPEAPGSRWLDEGNGHSQATESGRLQPEGLASPGSEPGASATGQATSRILTLPGTATILEMDLPPHPVSAAILEIEDWTLSPWEHRIVTEALSFSRSPPEPSESEPVSPEPEALSAAPFIEQPSIEQEATAVIDRLLPRWVDRMRAELLEELKRER